MQLSYKILPLLLASITVVPYDQVAVPYNSISNRFAESPALLRSQTAFLPPSTRLARLPAGQVLVNLTARPVTARSRDGKRVRVRLEAYFSFAFSRGADLVAFLENYGDRYRQYCEAALRGSVFRLATSTALAALPGVLADPRSHRLPASFRLSYVFVIEATEV